MANISLDWEVEGTITAKESVTGMLRVITSKTFAATGSFWTWEGTVSTLKLSQLHLLIITSDTHGKAGEN